MAPTNEIYMGEMNLCFRCLRTIYTTKLAKSFIFSWLAVAYLCANRQIYNIIIRALFGFTYVNQLLPYFSHYSSAVRLYVLQERVQKNKVLEEFHTIACRPFSHILSCRRWRRRRCRRRMVMNWKDNPLPQKKKRVEQQLTKKSALVLLRIQFFSLFFFSLRQFSFTVRSNFGDLYVHSVTSFA